MGDALPGLFLQEYVKVNPSRRSKKEMRNLTIMGRAALMGVVLWAASGAWGYGLDGERNSEDFENIIGPYDMGYPYWS